MVWRGRSHIMPADVVATGSISRSMPRPEAPPSRERLQSEGRSNPCLQLPPSWVFADLHRHDLARWRKVNRQQMTL